METDCLEVNSMHQTPSVDGGEVNTNALNSIDENLSSIEVSKPKTVHQFYFAKMRPYNDPDEASKIAEAEKLTSDLLEVEKRFRMLRLEWRDGWLQPVELQRRRGGISYCMEREKIVLDQLQVALNKLNILCQQRGADHKSTLSVERQSGPRQGLKCRMRMPHGSSNNLVTERKLLRQITTSQEITKEYGLVREIGWYPMSEKIKQIEQRKEKALADAIATGDIWDPFTAKRAIQEQIKLLNKLLEESREELCEVNVELKRVMKNIKTIEKEEKIQDLIEQRRELRSQKWTAQHWISRRRSQWMNNKYEENMMEYMNNARELARRKDVHSVRKLSRQQMNKFLLEWNQNIDFRLGYEVTILKSLEERGLSRDGRIKSDDDDT